MNYNYPLASVVYRLLSVSSPEYAEFLHEQGYMGSDGKPRKLFTISGLKITPKTRPLGDVLPVLPESRAVMYLSSPMIRDFCRHFVAGLFQNNFIEIGNHKHTAVFQTVNVETLPDPVFTHTTRFRCLSPVVVSCVVDKNGKRQKYYHRPLDPDLSEAIRLSLVKKYRTITQREPGSDDLVFEPDRDYIQKRGGQQRVSRLVRVREGRPDETAIKGFMLPFTLTGSGDLKRTAWEAGLGDQCSMGFGCIEIVQ